MIIVVFRNPLAQNNRQGKKANKKSTCWIWLTSILLHRNRLFPPKSMENSIFRRLHLCHHQNAQNATFADLYHLGPLWSLVSHCQLGQVSNACWMLVAWKLSSWNQWLWVANLDRHKPKLLRMRTTTVFGPSKDSKVPETKYGSYWKSWFTSGLWLYARLT